MPSAASASSKANKVRRHLSSHPSNIIEFVVVLVWLSRPSSSWNADGRALLQLGCAAFGGRYYFCYASPASGAWAVVHYIMHYSDILTVWRSSSFARSPNCAGTGCSSSSILLFVFDQPIVQDGPRLTAWVAPSLQVLLRMCRCSKCPTIHGPFAFHLHHLHRIVASWFLRCPWWSKRDVILVVPLAARAS